MLAVAAPIVMIDAIPTGATLFNVAMVRFPYSDLDQVDSKKVETDIALATSNAMELAGHASVSYVCLLSSGGMSSRRFTIRSAHLSLNLPRINPSFVMLLFRGGRDPASPIRYFVGPADKQKPHVSMTFKRLMVPGDWSTAAWVYFNLSRIQDEASKAGATDVFLESDGRGATSTTVIPGTRDPLTVFAKDATLSATWYVRTGGGM
jgi:hypothetical protein